MFLGTVFAYINIIDTLNNIIMKKIFLILMLAFVGVSCESEEIALIDTSINYNLVNVNNTSLTIALESLDVSNNNFTINSYTPNTSCCLGGSFTTDNTVDGFANSTSLTTGSVNVSGNFNITLENFNEGMNYFTIELDNGLYKKYFSFQFNLENNQIDYLMVVSNNNNDNNVSNYADALFKYDIHTSFPIRILTETEAGINIFRDNITNDSNQLSYITTVRATTILKTLIEKL